MIPSISEHSMFQNMIFESNVSYYVKNKDFRFVFVNRHMADRLGAADQSEVMGKTDFDYPGSSDALKKQEVEKTVMENGSPAEDLVEAHCKGNGSKTWSSSSTYPLHGDDGEVIGIWGIIRDITEYEQAKEELHEILVRYRQLGEQSRIFNWEVDEQGLYTYADSFVEEILGYRADELIGQMHFYDLCPMEGRTAFKDAALEVFMRKEPFQNFENKAQAKDGHAVWLSTSGIPLLKDDGTLKGYHGNDFDITQKKDRESQIIYLSYHDQLTGLYNRRFYEEELNRLDTERNLPISIVMGDVNGLKMINDSFGHAMGDELLMKTANVIRNGCRADDIVARLGGDEFVILLPKTDVHEADAILARIKDLSSREKVCSQDLSISFGCKTKNSMVQNIQDTVKNAEDHMYRNKLSESSGMRDRKISLIMNDPNESRKQSLDEINPSIGTQFDPYAGCTLINALQDKETDANSFHDNS